MRLAQFIREERERILEEFEEFARTHTAAGDTMDIQALRDHAAGMLSTIALDLEQPQSDGDQERKSKGDAPDDGQAADTSAEKHGTDRADSGFSLEEMISEYRALRASVVRLWTDDRTLDGTDVQDLIRFNEAIDMAMAESIPTFTAALDYSRQMFLAVLGHDLRTPLNAIVAASSFLATNGTLTGRDLTLAKRVHSSGTRMDHLLSDLIDLTNSRFGRGIPIIPVEIDLVESGQEAVDECLVTHPTGEVRFEVSGNLRGAWDPDRLSQALCNLVGNAMQHGSASTPIMVTARGEADEVVVSVHNHGRVIEPEDQERIFDPFERIVSAESERPRVRNSGLGLYIAEQIALAHGGSIRLRSTEEEGTTFELRLPRRAAR
ncbi:MAG: HAMP domain-containing sensor histidine kinase [Gemmatimonadota bacterium]